MLFVLRNLVSVGGAVPLEALLPILEILLFLFAVVPLLEALLPLTLWDLLLWFPCG